MLEVAVYLLTLGSAVLMTVVGMRLFPAVGGAVLQAGSGRLRTIDGLRGILALSVVLHHSVFPFITRHGSTSEADLAAHPFSAQLGGASVGLFFLVSAYLFGGRLLRNGGRLDVVEFAVSRVARLVPLYLAFIGSVVLVSLVRQGFTLVDPVDSFLRQIARFLSFGFLPRHSLNGWDGAPAVLGMIWTLRYECLFYALVPVMAVLYRRTRHVAALYLPLVLPGLLWSPYFLLFTAGLAAAQLKEHGKGLAGRGWTGIALGALLVLFTCYHDVAGWQQAVLLVFALVATLRAQPPFSLLALPVFRYLGEISYSIYLTHGLVLYAFDAVLAPDPVSLSTGRYLMIAVGQVGATIALSTATFLLVERPFMRIRLPVRTLRRIPDMMPGRAA